MSDNYTYRIGDLIYIRGGTGLFVPGTQVEVLNRSTTHAYNHDIGTFVDVIEYWVTDAALSCWILEDNLSKSLSDIPGLTACSCGSDKLKHPGHSYFCEKFEK